MAFKAEFERHSQLIAAVLTVVASVLGVWVALATGARGEAESTVDALERQVAADRSALNSLRGTNDQLQREIEEKDRLIAALEGQLPSDAPPPTDGEPPVRHQGQVNLADDVINLNAPSSDPTWGAGEERGIYSKSDEVRYSRLGLSVEAPYLVLPSGTQPSFAACSTATGYQQGVGQLIEPEELETPACVRLESGRYATLKAVSWTNDVVTLDVTTWERA